MATTFGLDLGKQVSGKSGPLRNPLKSSSGLQNHKKVRGPREDGWTGEWGSGHSANLTLSDRQFTQSPGTCTFTEMSTKSGLLFKAKCVSLHLHGLPKQSGETSGSLGPSTPSQFAGREAGLSGVGGGHMVVAVVRGPTATLRGRTGPE